MDASCFFNQDWHHVFEKKIKHNLKVSVIWNAGPPKKPHLIEGNVI